MTAKFKNGKWVHCFANGIVIQTEDTGYGICKVIGNLESDKANASLIACAPEMYEMLEHVNALLVNVHSPLHDDINKLLAKARGDV
jgi:hypothetical protein